MWMLYSENVLAYENNIAIGALMPVDYGVNAIQAKVNDVHMKYVRINGGQNIVDVYAINFVTGQIVRSGYYGRL
jgi:hypothetical protein